MIQGSGELYMQDTEAAFHAFFSGYPVKNYKKRKIFINAGEAFKEIFYIKKGYIKAYAVGEDGQELTMVLFGPGNFFPLVANFNPAKSRYYMESLTDVEVIPVPRMELIKILKENQDLMVNLVLRLTARFEGALIRMEQFNFGNAAQKIASIVAILGERFGKKEGKYTVVQCPLTHKEIAELVGLTRETTTLMLRDLVKRGVIAFKNKRLIIKDELALQDNALEVGEVDI